MRISGQVVALGGVILIGGSLGTADDAHAFGQQWRPTAAYPVAQGFIDRRVSNRRIANVPSFRPHAVARQNNYAATPTAGRYRAVQRMARNSLRQRPMAPAYRMPAPAPLTYPGGLPGNHYAASGWPGMPMWSDPFGQMVRAWQNPMPVFTRQFAWRPAEQPWRARQTISYARPQYSGRPASAVRYGQQQAYSRPLANRFAQNSWRGQAWRPAARVASNRSYPNASRLVASYRPSPTNFTQAPRRGQAAAFVAASHQGAHWRPSGAAVAAAYPVDRSFRPATYGKYRLAAARPGNSTASRPADRLPGWVTTYQEPDVTDGCSWCSGS